MFPRRLLIANSYTLLVISCVGIDDDVAGGRVDSYVSLAI